MHVDKSLIQKKAKFYLSELRGWNTFFTWWSCAFFKVTYSGQKLNYKDSLPSPWYGSVGYSLCVCQLSCPYPEPAQLCKIVVPCAKQKQVVETHPPEHSGTVWFSFPTTSGSLTPRLWQTRQHSPMQYPTVGSPSCLACSGGCDVKIPISATLCCQFLVFWLISSSLLLKMWLQPGL